MGFFNNLFGFGRKNKTAETCSSKSNVDDQTRGSGAGKSAPSNLKFMEGDKQIIEIVDEQLAKNLLTDDNLYMLLSTTKADMINGYSFPYVGNKGGENVILFLFVFRSLEKARQYVDDCGYEVLDGVYPIGKITTNEKFFNLENTLAIAKTLGIKYVELDGKEYFDIDWFFNVNKIEKQSLNIMLKKEELDEIKGKSELGGDKIPVRFNPINIVGYNNPYNITDERRKELVEFLMKCPARKDGISNEEFMSLLGIDTLGIRNEIDQSWEEAVQYFMPLNLAEICFLNSIVQFQFLPKAQKEDSNEDLFLLKKVLGVIFEVTWRKLKEKKKLFTIADRTTKNLLVREGHAYILYTDLFKYQGKFDYVEINGEEELKNLISKTNAKAIVVTDGPSHPAIIPIPQENN
ncbi:MAG: hypothetical protein PUC42_02415 [Bacteroidales bacterium]|nr:hypothetical protein [Bacteroidales bacterium]